MEEATISIRELSARLNRVPHTVRQWEAKGWLPVDLLPIRNNNNRRLWTESQLQGIRQWIEDQDIRPGKALHANKK